ncbi:PKD domain-containing protein [Marivirga tractuosa]|uniref:T9SS type A sorting domain-containing protein n=1 Tax=Marivirga tractuosa TaxID=1006 RepID=UPI0035D0F1B4
MRYLLVFLFFILVNKLTAQVNADFNMPAEVCLEEQFLLENTSTNAVSYKWDFCSYDNLEFIPQTQALGSNNYGAPFHLKIIENNGNFHGFIAGRTTNKIYRLDFGNNPKNTPVYNDLGGTSILNNPSGIDIKKIGENWYGLVTGYASNKLYLLEFGNSLEATPIISDISNSMNLNLPMDVKIMIDSGNIFAFIVNNVSGEYPYLRLNFGSDITTTPIEDEFTVSGANALTSIDIKKENSNWFGFLVSRNNQRLYRINFGSSISNSPTYSDVSTPIGVNMDNPGGLKMVKEIDSAYVFVQSRNGPLYKFHFGDDFSNTASAVDFGNIYSDNRNWGIDFIKVNSQWVGYNANFGDKIYRIDFPSNCSLDNPISWSKNPVLSFSQPGQTLISLKANDSNGFYSNLTKEITVTNNQAPDISFSIGDNLCIANPIQFESQGSATISSYDWDFGDSNSATTANPSHTYASAGTYAVKLSVTDANGCNNLFIDTVSVFEEPTPDFQATAQGSICSQKPIVFDNLTTLPTEATFSWDLGDGSTSTEENPEHVYAEAGDYTVIQSINMAGCTVEKTKIITVNPGPAVAFQTSNNCLGEILQFENTSQGDFLDSYQWDFGDGTQSTQANPSHLYDTAGVYEVQLSAFTTNGCDFTITQQIEIQPLAEIDFLSDVACAGQPSQFSEQVTVDQSNITDYLWNFGVAGTQSDVSTEANPQFAYPAAGTYNVSLQVTTSDGCTSSGSQQITVNTAPEAAFEFDETCLDQARLFTPLDTTSIISHFWELQNSHGEIVESSQSTHFSYLFAEAGTYQLTYRQENENLCSQSTTQTLSIKEQPIPDFGWSTACAGEVLQLNNLTDLNGNTLKNYKWSIEEEVISTDTRPQYTFEESGEYTVSLEVKTIGGCVQKISKTILVSPAPTASFELEQNVGAYPFELSLNADQYQVASSEYLENSTETADTTNLSTRQLGNLATYFWTLNGDTISTTSELNYVIEEAGTYLLGFLLTNDAGCTDEYYEQIKVKEPSLDVSLSNLRVNKDDEFTSFILNINNRGSLVPERIDLAIDLGSYSVTESLETPLYPEQNRNFSLSLKLTEDQLKGLSKICINASPKVGEYTDSNIQNNRVCINLESGFKVMEIFPNPAVNQFTIPVITPEQDKLTISMEDSNGRQVKVFNYDLEAGYNELRIQRERLSPGIYFLRFRYQGQEKVKKIIFQ